jgi:GT2 family glycosyltransferase
MTTAHGPSPARNRNIIIEQALENNCTHIFFLDDDTAFEPDLLYRLLRHDKDMISGLYLMRNYPHQSIIFDVVKEDGSAHWYSLPKNCQELIEVVGAGLGAALIKTDVFRALEKPWIRIGELEKDHWCDDLGFYRRARAAGFKLFCDTTALVGHMASVTIYPQRAPDGTWLVSYDTKGPSRVAFPAINFDDFVKENNARIAQMKEAAGVK